MSGSLYDGNARGVRKDPAGARHERTVTATLEVECLVEGHATQNEVAEAVAALLPLPTMHYEQTIITPRGVALIAVRGRKGPTYDQGAS